MKSHENKSLPIRETQYCLKAGDLQPFPATEMILTNDAFHLHLGKATDHQNLLLLLKMVLPHLEEETGRSAHFTYTSQSQPNRLFKPTPWVIVFQGDSIQALEVLYEHKIISDFTLNKARTTLLTLHPTVSIPAPEEAKSIATPRVIVKNTANSNDQSLLLQLPLALIQYLMASLGLTTLFRFTSSSTITVSLLNHEQLWRVQLHCHFPQLLLSFEAEKELSHTPENQLTLRGLLEQRYQRYPYDSPFIRHRTIIIKEGNLDCWRPYASQIKRFNVGLGIIGGDFEIRCAILYERQDLLDLVYTSILDYFKNDFTQRDTHNNTLLHWIAVLNQVPALKQALAIEKSLDINLQNHAMETPLSLAAEYGCNNIVTLLLETQHVDVQYTQNSARYSPLIKAAAEGHATIVAELLPVYLNSLPFLQEEALRTAARYGQSKVVALLLSQPGIKINAVDMWGYTAIMSAASYGDEKTMNCLLAYENIDINITQRNDTALTTAVCYGNGAAVNCLLKAKSIAIAEQWESALLIAIRKGETTILRLLLEAYIPKQISNLAALHIAWQKAIQNGTFDTVRLALASLPWINVNTTDSYANTSLMIAIEYHHFEMAEWLLTLPNIDRLAINASGNNAFILAIECDAVNVALALLQQAPSCTHIITQDGDTPLMLAANKNNLLLVEKLLALHPATLNHQNKSGTTALMLAVINNHSEIIQHLLTIEDIDQTLKNSKGETAFLLAQRYHATIINTMFDSASTIQQHQKCVIS